MMVLPVNSGSDRAELKNSCSIINDESFNNDSSCYMTDNAKDADDITP